MVLSKGTRGGDAMGDTVIVVPCYDEARRLNVGAFQQFATEFDSVAFLFVDDGSRDQTLQVLDHLVATAPDRFARLSLGRNYGKAEAVRRGLLHALASDVAGPLPAFAAPLFSAGPRKRRVVYIGYWDADLATPLSTILSFRQWMEDHPQTELVLGSRVRLLGHDIQRHRMRHGLSRVFSRLASGILGFSVYDTQCGAKLIRVLPHTEHRLQQPFRSRWLFDVELLARWRCVDGRQVRNRLYEYPLESWHEMGGSKMTWRYGVRAVWDSMVLFWHYRRSRAVREGGTGRSHLEATTEGVEFAPEPERMLVN
jgi:dolichyl-phosphate beta-glucosyltransferase